MGKKKRRFSLEWRLGITTSIVVVGIMGFVTTIQQTRELKRQRIGRELLLRESLAPLAVLIEKAANTDQLRTSMMTFHEAYIREGYTMHEVDLRDDAGKLIYSTRKGVPSTKDIVPTEHTLSARYPVSSDLIEGGHGFLTVSEDASEFRAAESRQWKSWAVHVLITALSIVTFLMITVRVLILRPLYKLIDAVRLVDAGYWNAVEIPRGAWELRWLAKRFRAMSRRLERTVNDLLAAERRVSERSEDVSAGDVRAGGEGDSVEPLRRPGGDREVRRPIDREELAERLSLLSHVRRGAPESEQAAIRALAVDSPAAERCGDYELKNAIENAAYEIILGEEFRRFKREVDRFAQSRREWVSEIEEAIQQILRDRGIPFVSLQHRVKHPAGVWEKMKRKGLTLERVHDFFGFRIIVRDENGCYSALKATHDLFVPKVGRFKDYIAHPKDNGYRSLHTSVRANDGTVFEVQIRSEEMEKETEGGGASHWRYKESTVARPEPPDGRIRRFIRNVLLGPSADAVEEDES